MAVAGVRLCLLTAGLLASLLLLTGVCQLVCGLYLLLKAPRPAVNGATITAGVWDVVVGLVTVMLCFAGPLRASRRSQLQLAAFCSAPMVNAALGVLIGLAPNTEQPSDVTTVCIILSVSTAVAAGVSFLAANVVFCMQLKFDQYRPGTQAWKSPKSVSPSASSFLFSQAQMTQKSGEPDLWLTGAVPLASWVYRTQASVETTRCETQLDAPPAEPHTPLSRSSRGNSSLALRTAPTSAPRPEDEPTGRLPRCLSLLSAFYGPSRGGWPPTGRPLRSCSLLEVRPPPAGPEDAEPGSPAPFPPAPAPLCASPLPTPVADRQLPGTPLGDTIGRLETALSRLHSDPHYRASRELQEALEALQDLQPTPGPGRQRPASDASRTASSGYGSPDGSKEAPPPERRSVVQLVSLLEEGRRTDAPLRRPTVPPPPPPLPPPGSGSPNTVQPGDERDQLGSVPPPPVAGVTAEVRQSSLPVVESEC